jgi:hypothetical protein
VWKFVFIAVFLISLPTVSNAQGLNGMRGIQETFRNPCDWKPLLFDKSKKDTVYSVGVENGAACLKAQSDHSASALVWDREFDPYRYPVVRWRWKVSNVYVKGDIREKKANDSPARLFVMFKYDPEKAGFFKRIVYSMAKKMYGQYPPQSALCYIWASRPHKDRIIPSPSYGAIRYIVLEDGDRGAGQWRQEDINILKDYQQAFGKMPPRTNASIAFMDDSDDTGESSTSWLSSLELMGDPDPTLSAESQARGLKAPAFPLHHNMKGESENQGE